jgi:hypothetical protein
VVRKVCGNTFGVGLTVSVPSLKEVKKSSLPLNGTVWMKHSHQVRIVTCQPYEQDVDFSKSKRCCSNDSAASVYQRPRKLRCSYRGLDFRHVQSKNGTWELAVQVRFVKVMGSAPAVVKAQSVVLATGVSSASDVESEDLEVCVGAYIRIGTPPNLNTYVIESIDSNGTVCCKDATDDNEDPVFLSLAEANELYNRYIRY